jgi:hypothetical protein
MKNPRKPRPKVNPKTVRVRYEPPTLDEAIFAAQGMSDNPAAQVEMVASLMGLPEEEVRARVLAQAPTRGGSQQVVMTTRNGTQRSVVVQRKTPRRIVLPPRVGQSF